jgi:hypothetical protein
MIDFMFLADSLSGLNHRRLSSVPRRSRSKQPARRRHSANPVSGIQTWMLEERLLLSRAHLLGRPLDAPSQTTVYVANADGKGTVGPYTLTKPAANPGSVIFLGGTSPNTPDMDWGDVPTKTITFTNNSNTHQTIYPFLYTANTEKIYDPIDINDDEYRLYIGYQKDGKEILGLPYGDSITINVPLVFWNGGRADIATDGSQLLPKPSQVDTLNPYGFRYTASTYIGTSGVISSTDSGILMYYKQNSNKAPVDPSPAAPGQLAEWTIRDQAFLTKVNAYDQRKNIGTIPASELTTLVNYDVSYVDDLMAPVAITGLNVPVPVQYIQSGTAATSGNTTTITLPADATSLVRLLTKILPYTKDAWQVKYSTLTSTTEIGTVTNVSDNTLTVVSSGAVSGLPTGATGYVFYTNSVKQDYGWTGANNDIKQIQDGLKDFTSNDATKNDLGQYFGGLGWPEYYNPDKKALIKIPSGASILINSPLTTKTSPFNINHYLLTSGNDGKRIFYNATEVLDPENQPLDKGATVTFKLSGEVAAADHLAAIKKQGGTWVLSDGLNTTGTKLIGTINVASIDTTNKTMTVTLAQAINFNKSGYSYTIVSPPTDPYAAKMTNLWYSWAQYYEDLPQFKNFTTQTLSAKVTTDTDNNKNDYRILTFSSPQPQLAVGMQVTNPAKTLQPLITIIKIVTQVNGPTLYYLSRPVPGVTGPTTMNLAFSKPQPIAFSSTPGLNTDLINPTGFGSDAAFAQAFSASVYEMMSAYSTVVNKTGLPNDTNLIYEAIGGNVGHLSTAKPVNYVNISADVRDLGKSVLRGVPNFLTYPDTHTSDNDWKPGDWYPPPSKSTDGTDYNVFNLDPFVWFVHQKLGLSGYGFSFDDDVSDVGAGGASAITITYASGPAANPVESQWFPSTPWGAVTAMATISPAPDTSPYKGKSILTIEPKDTKAFWQVSADDLKNGQVGAYVSTKDSAVKIPAKTNLLASLDSNALQFVLSTAVKPTTKPIPVTFTGYLPKP